MSVEWVALNGLLEDGLVHGLWGQEWSVLDALKGGVCVSPDTMNKGGNLYHYGKFIDIVEQWVDEIDDPDLNRAWEISKACVQAHAKVDREDGQSVRLARALAWADFAQALAGHVSTYTMFGMARELTCTCADIGREEQFDAVVSNADLVAGGVSPGMGMVVDDQGNEIPVLELIWDRDLEH